MQYTQAQIDRANTVSLEDFSAHRERRLSKRTGIPLERT